MGASISCQYAFLRRKGPADFRLHVQAQVPGHIELDAAGAKQGKAEAVPGDFFSSQRRADAPIAGSAAAHIDIQPAVGSQCPVETQRNAPDISTIV